MSWAIWITGLPGSGKSTIARAAASMLEREEKRHVVLELDRIRRVLTPSPTHSDTEREAVYRSLVWIAMTLVDSGLPVIIDATAHRRRWRELARAFIPRFAEIQLTCPPAVCRDREATHARDLDVPYERSQAPDLEIDTTTTTATAAAHHVAALARSLDAATARDRSPGDIPTPWAIWITGLPGSGKTTNAFGAARILGERGVPVRVLSFNEACHYVLCGLPVVDGIEDVFNRALVCAAVQLTGAGLPVIVDATAAQRRWRDLARAMIPDFAEVQLECPREVCATRERAVRWHLPARAHVDPCRTAGHTAPDLVVDYQPALAPELVLYTDVEDPGTTIESVVVLAHRLQEMARRRPTTREERPMRRLLISSMVLASLLIGMSPAVAQQATPRAGAPGPPQQMAPGPGGGMGQGPMMGGGMMGGAHACPMMASGMMAGPMGMMREEGDRAPSAQMVQMRGEMMKAMGEIMMKYGKLMESQPR